MKTQICLNNGRYRAAFLLGVLSSVLCFGCLPKDSAPDKEAAKGKKATHQVLAAMVVAKEVPLVHQSPGEIVPANRIRIHADSNVTVAEVFVHEGQKINAGTTVLKYDTALAKTKIELATAEIDEAEAAIDFEQFRFENRDSLLDDDEITPVVYDYLEKKLEYEKTRAKRAKAELGYLQQLVKKTDVVSSISGVVTNRNVADGLPVVEGQFLMEILQDDPVKLKVRLPEEFIPATYRGQLLQVKYPNVTEEQTVKITEVGVEVDPLTRTFEVLAKLDNPNGLLKTGMELPTTLMTDKKTVVISVPKSAIALRNKKTVVFHIVDGIAKSKAVRLGRTFGDQVAVLQGVKEADILVLDPPKGLKNGDRVEIRTAAAPPAE